MKLHHYANAILIYVKANFIHVWSQFHCLLDFHFLPTLLQIKPEYSAAKPQ